MHLYPLAPLSFTHAQPAYIQIEEAAVESWRDGLGPTSGERGYNSRAGIPLRTISVAQNTLQRDC